MNEIMRAEKELANNCPLGALAVAPGSVAMELASEKIIKKKLAHV